MYQVTGNIINVFSAPKTEKFEESFKVQVLGDSLTVDGQVKKDLITLNIPKPVFDSLQGRQGEEITLPIGFYVKSGNLVTYFPKSEAKNVTIGS